MKKRMTIKEFEEEFNVENSDGTEFGYLFDDDIEMYRKLKYGTVSQEYYEKHGFAEDAVSWEDISDEDKYDDFEEETTEQKSGMNTCERIKNLNTDDFKIFFEQVSEAVIKADKEIGFAEEEECIFKGTYAIMAGSKNPSSKGQIIIDRADSYGLIKSIDFVKVIQNDDTDYYKKVI